MNANDFGNIVRVANCLSYNELKDIFGQDVDHYIAKLESKGLAGFIMYLDGCNLNNFFFYCNSKMEAQKLKYGA